MNTKSNVESFSEWEQLSQLDIPELKTPHENGKVFHVLKVGVLFADIKQCTNIDTRNAFKVDGKVALPTATIHVEQGERTLFRLPIDIGQWASHNLMAVKQTQNNHFPADVEFSILNGKHCADFVM